MRLIAIILILFPLTSIAQTYECNYVDFGDGIHFQPTTITQTDTNVTIIVRDSSYYTSFYEKLQEAGEILHIEFGQTTIMLTEIGNAVMFRKCKAKTEEQ